MSPTPCNNLPDLPSLAWGFGFHSHKKAAVPPDNRVRMAGRTKEKSQKLMRTCLLGRIKEALSRDFLHFIGQNPDTCPPVPICESEKMSLSHSGVYKIVRQRKKVFSGVRIPTFPSYHCRCIFSYKIVKCIGK